MNPNVTMLEAMRQEMFARYMAAENEAAGDEVAKDEESFIRNLEHLATVDEDDSTKTRFLPVNIKWNIYRLMYPEAAYTVDIEMSKIDNKDFCTAKVYLFRDTQNLKDGAHSGFGMKTLALENVPVFADISERVELWRSMAFKSALSKALDSEGVAPWIPSREDKDQTQVLPSANKAAIDEKVKAAMERTQNMVKEGAAKKAEAEKPKQEQQPQKKEKEELPISDGLPTLEEARAFTVRQGGQNITLGEYEQKKPRKLVTLFAWKDASKQLKDNIRVIIKADMEKYKKYFEAAKVTENDF